jgi:hypothetical protein
MDSILAEQAVPAVLVFGQPWLVVCFYPVRHQPL